MNRLTHTRSAAGTPERATLAPTNYTRTSERAHELGFIIHPFTIDGDPVFLVSRGAASRVLPSLEAIDSFLDLAAAPDRGVMQSIAHSAEGGAA